MQSSGCRVQGAGFRVQVSGFWVQGSGFRAQGSGFGIEGVGAKGVMVKGDSGKEVSVREFRMIGVRGKESGLSEYS